MSTNEQRLIETIKNWTGGSIIGDDCAILPGRLLATADSLVEGTHFEPQWTSYPDIGWKSAAVNLSDIAAMAGRPRHLIVSLTVPPSMRSADFADFYKSFIDCTRTYRAQVVGGDLTKGPIFVVAVTALGDVHENGCLTRSGAKPGDAVVVTGDFGASSAGLRLLQRGGGDRSSRAKFPYCFTRHERPLPRLCESWALVRKTGNRGALMDASDGLADALAQISDKSGVGMDINLDAVPVHEQTREAAASLGADVTDLVLYGGEDYELVGTLPDNVWNAWQGQPDNPFTKIGVVSALPGITLTVGGKKGLSLDLAQCYEQIFLQP